MKDGTRTTEFWLAVATNVIAVVATVAEMLPAKYSVPILAAINGLYAIARGIAKIGKPA